MGLGRNLGRSDGRRTSAANLLPNLNSQPFTQVQKATLDAKAFSVTNAPPFIHPNLNFFNPPADSDSFTLTPSPFPNYPPVAPATGGGAITVISYTVPRGKLAVITKMSIVHFGGNPPDGTGRVIWRVLRNGAGLRGLSTLMAQYGTFANPKQVAIFCWENDTISITVECPDLLPNGNPNPGPPSGSTTAASFDGYMYPLSEATFPLQGSY
jgi:hypothetical protein